MSEQWQRKTPHSNIHGHWTLLLHIKGNKDYHYIYQTLNSWKNMKESSLSEKMGGGVI